MTESHAAEVIERALVWENHCCMPFENIERWMPQLERYRAAGFDVVHVNIGDSDVSLDRMFRSLAAYRHWLAANAERYALVRTVQDVADARGHGRLAVCFDIEGGLAFGTDLAPIPMFYELGVRWLLPVYNRTNAIGSGCHDPTDDGLTVFGRRFMAEMDRVGMIKDVAHTGYRTAREIIDASAVPVNISHSNPRALNDHPRCVPDDLMKACAASGGVLGISGIGLFLGDNDTSTERMVRSIDYAVEVMGIDHVGIGLDYVFDQEGLSADTDSKRHFWPHGFGYGAGSRFVPPEQLSDIVSALIRRGYPDTDMEKLLGGNFLRVAGQVWK